MPYLQVVPAALSSRACCPPCVGPMRLTGCRMRCPAGPHQTSWPGSHTPPRWGTQSSALPAHHRAEHRKLRKYDEAVDKDQLVWWCLWDRSGPLACHVMAWHGKGILCKSWCHLHTLVSTPVNRQAVSTIPLLHAVCMECQARLLRTQLLRATTHDPGVLMCLLIYLWHQLHC